jgi:hypothetical protein
MKAEEFNPWYSLLLLASVAFVVTCLAYALVPWDQQPEWLQVNGWKLLLGEVAAVLVFGLLSMALDRLRSLRASRAAATPPETAARQEPEA